MKKIKVLGLFIMLMVLSAGCGKKTLTCTQETDENGMATKQEIKMVFKSDKVTSVKMDMGFSITNDQMKEYWPTMVESLENGFAIEETKGVKVETKKDDKNYKLNYIVEIDLKKASKDELTKIGLDDVADESSSYTKTKEEAEKDGYTCK